MSWIQDQAPQTDARKVLDSRNRWTDEPHERHEARSRRSGQNSEQRLGLWRALGVDIIRGCSIRSRHDGQGVSECSIQLSFVASGRKRNAVAANAETGRKSPSTTSPRGRHPGAARVTTSPKRVAVAW